MTPLQCPHCQYDISNCAIVYGRCPSCGEFVISEDEMRKVSKEGDIHRQFCQNSARAGDIANIIAERDMLRKALNEKDAECVMVKSAMACAIQYLWQAHSDIGDWIRLASRQFELLPANHPARPMAGAMAASEELLRQMALVCADSTRSSVAAEYEAMAKVVTALNIFALNWYPVQNESEITIIGIADDFDTLSDAMDALRKLHEDSGSR